MDWSDVLISADNKTPPLIISIGMIYIRNVFIFLIVSSTLRHLNDCKPEIYIIASHHTKLFTSSCYYRFYGKHMPYLHSQANLIFIVSQFVVLHVYNYVYLVDVTYCIFSCVESMNVIRFIALRKGFILSPFYHGFMYTVYGQE